MYCVLNEVWTRPNPTFSSLISYPFLHSPRSHLAAPTAHVSFRPTKTCIVSNQKNNLMIDIRIISSMTSSLPLHLPPPPHLLHGFQTPIQSNSIQFQIRRGPKSTISTSFSSSNPSSSSSSDREEIRWLREEQRWIREEQRWIREQSSWNSERQSLLQEIASLKLQIQALEREKSSSSSISDSISNLASILQALKESESESESKSASNRIAESGSRPRPMLLEEGDVKEMILEEIKVSEIGEEMKKEEVVKKKKRVALRKGSEGEDVQEMQVCVFGN